MNNKKMNHFFQKFGKKKGDGGADMRPDPEYLLNEEEYESEPETGVFNTSDTPPIVTEREIEDVCEEDTSTSTPSPVPVDAVDDSHYFTAPMVTDGSSIGSFLTMPFAITAISTTLALIVLARNYLRRRKQRRQRRMWKKDSQKILTRVEDVMLQLEERDGEVDLLEQQLKTQEKNAAKEKETLAQESTQALATKDEECQELKATIAELLQRQKETDARLEKVAAETKRFVEAQQDHDCQLLQQKLQASQLSNTIVDREAQIEELQQTIQTQAGRIQEFQQRIKSDGLKAEKIIQELTSERDDRFSILQQENDAIKTTIMGMLKQTQERYDADKVLLKKEMRRRDDKIQSLQQELWQSNALLKRVKGEQGATGNDLSQSFRNLIDDIKETKELASKSGGKERRSSTYEAAETILEGDGNCEELQELQTMLEKTSVIDV